MSRSEMEIMTAPDIHVGPAWPRCAASTRGAQLLSLARLLLRSARELCLLLVALPMSACIIPVGPEFRDPDGVPNSPPFIISSVPLNGETSTGDIFTITPSDVNGDALHVRWLRDYPPFIPTISDPEDDDLPPGWRGPFSRRFDCLGVTAPSPHKITVLVSDRPFLSDPLDPTRVDEGVHPARVSWRWLKDCSQVPP